MAVTDIQKVDYLICGTSWESTHENEALKIAKEFGVRVISVLDHYSSYTERFIKDGYDIVPAEIWVTDELSLQLAREVNLDATIQIVGNPYLEEMKAAFQLLEVSSHSSYISPNQFLSKLKPSMEMKMLGVSPNLML